MQGSEPPPSALRAATSPSRGGFDERANLSDHRRASRRASAAASSARARLPRAYNAAVAAAELLNAYTVETPDDALAAADAADKARLGGEPGPLAGIPLGIKDLFATKGVDTTAGSRILKGFKPPYESTVTAQSAQGGGGDARQAQHGRVRDGLVERDQRLRPGDQPVAAQGQQCRR